MEWFVYREDINRHSIERINVAADCERLIRQLKRKSKGYGDFCERLRREMMWHYWARSEYELLLFITNSDRIILKPWINPRNVDISLDVTDDEDFDWRKFASQYPENMERAEGVGVKIDVYAQLKFRWDDFCTYCWNVTLKWHSSDGGLHEYS